MPDFGREEKLWREGYEFVAGVDEAGRGPLAGPVVAAAVVFPPFFDAPWLPELKDSKKLPPQAREELFKRICEAALAIGIGFSHPREIDEMGILEATRKAMISAIRHLRVPPHFLLIDFVKLPEIPIPQESFPKGEDLSLSIAAASIVAKVTRDRHMARLEELFPGYGFSKHKGYPTPQHLEALRALGPSPVHRRSFKPVGEL